MGRVTIESLRVTPVRLAHYTFMKFHRLVWVEASSLDDAIMFVGFIVL